MKPHYFGLILLALLTVISVIAVRLYSRHLKKRRERAIVYNTIFSLMDYAVVDRAGYKYIRSKFDELLDYPDGDYEKIQVKEMEFLKKFYEFVPDVVVTSFNGTLEKRNIDKIVEHESK